jgi:hypothetical protein
MFKDFFNRSPQLAALLFMAALSKHTNAEKPSPDGQGVCRLFSHDRDKTWDATLASFQIYEISSANRFHGYLGTERVLYDKKWTKLDSKSELGPGKNPEVSYYSTSTAFIAPVDGKTRVCIVRSIAKLAEKPAPGVVWSYGGFDSDGSEETSVLNSIQKKLKP